MRFDVTYSGLIEVDLEGGEDRGDVIERTFDLVISELLLLDVEDPSVTGSIADGRIEIMCGVEADSFPGAVASVDSAVRAAFHAADVGTGEWSKIRRSIKWHRVEADEPDAVPT